MACVEAVVITNGRSTFEYALKSVKAQTVKLQIRVIKNSKWVEANNNALNAANSRLLLRVDDDMFLHPQALEYMLDTYHGALAHEAKLFEHFAHDIGGKVRLYNVKKTRRIGGFRPNNLGKIDRMFAVDAKKHGEEISTPDKHSPVGIHACAPWNEQKQYEKLWGYEKSRRELMKKYRQDVVWQAEHAIKLVVRYNHLNKTDFNKWLKK